VSIAWTNTVFGKLTVGVVRKIGCGKFHHPLRLLFHDRILAALLTAALLKPRTAVSTSGTAVPPPSSAAHNRRCQPREPALPLGWQKCKIFKSQLKKINSKYTPIISATSVCLQIAATSLLHELLKLICPLLISILYSLLQWLQTFTKSN